MPSSSSQKRGTKCGSTRYCKKPRTIHEELIGAAEVLKRSLRTWDQPNSDLATLGAIVDKIIAGDPTSNAILDLLNEPFVLTGDVLPQPRSLALADGQCLGPGSALRAPLINADRERLAQIYHSVLVETSTHESNYEEEFALERQQAIEDGQAAPTPSDAAKHPALDVEQTERQMQIGRPFGTTGPSISIYHSVFSKFKSLIKNPTPDISPATVAQAFDLIVAAAAIYPTENDRTRVITPIVQKLLGYPIVTVPSEFGFRPDGIIIYPGSEEGKIPLLVMEAKNEVGTGGIDPNSQAAFSFPGPQITVLGGILTNQFIVQPLGMPLGLSGSPDPDGLALHVAQVMTALRTCLNDLESFYDDLKKSHLLRADTEGAQWPVLRTFDNFVLKYTSKNLLSDRIGRAMFNAELIPKDEKAEQNAVSPKVKVKFTSQYSEEAHMLLAAKNLAPQLRYYEKLEDNLAVVVMDAVDGKNLASAKKERVSEQALQNIQDALATLHKENFVFGDLRPPNVMLCRDGVDGEWVNAMLVDFDWAGKVGERRYPASLNHKLGWVEGVEAGGLIQKEHDNAMFQRLR
ncbi:hypothetical protein FRC00_005319 [Tulasnella sp. 408]|nr:hypothetical protein FRC00_005319 [Tulasnella sp. 408]